MTNQLRKTKTADFATIQNGALYYEDVRQCGLADADASEFLDDPYLTAIRVQSLAKGWYTEAYLGNGVFIPEHVDTEFTIRKERRGQVYHWYAYRRVLGTLHKRYVGTSERVTDERLLAIAQALPCLPKKATV